MLTEAVAGSLAGSAALLAYGVRGRSSSLLAPSVYKGSSSRPTLALTFDDGPSEATEAVLEVLHRHGVRATFFACGLNARRLPRVARAVLAAGHEIGNHSQSHARLYFRSASRIHDEFQQAQDSLAAITGAAPRLMRPPFGVRWFGFRQMQRDLHLISVMWTLIARDWKLSASAIGSRLLQGASNGAILCLHDGRELQTKPDLSQTLRALRETLPALQDRGFQFETVTQILCPMN